MEQMKKSWSRKSAKANELIKKTKKISTVAK